MLRKLTVDLFSRLSILGIYLLAIDGSKTDFVSHVDPHCTDLLWHGEKNGFLLHSHTST